MIVCIAASKVNMLVEELEVERDRPTRNKAVYHNYMSQSVRSDLASLPVLDYSLLYSRIRDEGTTSVTEHQQQKLHSAGCDIYNAENQLPP